MQDILVQRAEQIARRAHQGQYRRDGVTPYIEHCQAVAGRVAGDQEAAVVAWLHDVIEDTSETPDSLLQSGIPERLVQAIILLTKPDDVGYQHYLQGIAANPLARKVKIADMLTNLSDEPTRAQIRKYAKGLLILVTDD